MNTATIIFGISVLCLFLILLCYLYYNFWWGKLLTGGAVLFLLTYIPTSLVIDANYCDFVINQTTVSGNVTTYNYDELCVTNSDRTSSNIYVSWLRLLRILIIAFGIAGFYYLFGEKLASYASSKGWR